MLPIYIGAEGEENQGLCTGSENFWCVNKKAPQENIDATLAFLKWVVTSDEGRDALANQMGFVTPFKAFDDGYTCLLYTSTAGRNAPCIHFRTFCPICLCFVLISNL